MSPTLIAALVAAQAPSHAQCRGQEFVELGSNDAVLIVQCSCNVSLTLALPRVEAVAVRAVVQDAKPKKAADDGS